MVDAVFIDSDDVAGRADAGEFVDAVREAYRQRGDGAPTRPRLTLRHDDPPGLFNSYSAILPETGVMGGYMYAAGFGDHDARFTTPLFDVETGRPLAVVDGAPLNTYKAGATGAVAVDALACEDASTLAVIGSGAQALGQLRAIVTVRDIERVEIYSTTPTHRETFAADASNAFDVTAVPAESSTEAVRDADIVVTATTASEPVVSDEAIGDGTHVNLIGQYDPDKREIEAATVARAKYVPDLRERAFQDAGAFLLARDAGVIDDDHVYAELGEVVAGKVPGRESDHEVTVFDSGGTALETVAAAYLLYEKAVEDGRGTPIRFASASEVYEGKRGDTTEEFD